MAGKKFIDEKERKRTVKNAIANERLEGRDVSKKFKQLSNKYVAGEATLADFEKQIKRRYGI